MSNEQEILENAIRDYATTPEPDPQFAARLERRLLAQRRESELPAGASAPSRLLRVLHVLWTQLKPARAALGAAAALVVLFVIAGLFATWFSSLSQSPPVAGPPNDDQGSPTPIPAVQDQSSPTPAAEEELAVGPHLAPVLGRLAYVWDGDIWLKELPGGEPQRLTTSGHAHSPRWSPSGRWLAYQEDDILWVLDTTASEPAQSMQTTASGGFAWAPSADMLAFTSSGLNVLDAASGTITTLVSLPPDGAQMHRILRPHWRPDGAAIAYEQLQITITSGDEEQDTPANAHSIWQAGLDGAEPVRLYDSGLPQRGQAVLAGWTADGNSLLFWQTDAASASLQADGAPLYALPAAGGEPQAVAGTESAVLPWPDFVSPAPTGHWLALVTGSGRQTWQNKQLVVTNLDDNPPLSTLAPDVALSPAWAPGAGRLAYVQMPPVDAPGGEEVGSALLQRSLHVVAFGGEPRALTNDPAYRDEHPLWSATGTHILFARVDAGDNASLWLIPAEGGEPQMVVEVLSPAPQQTGWMGTFGHVDWGHYYDWWPGRSGRSCPGQSESWVVEWVITPGEQIGYDSPEQALAAQAEVDRMPGSPQLGLETPTLVIWQMVQNGEEIGRVRTVRFEDGSWGATEGWHCTPQTPAPVP